MSTAAESRTSSIEKLTIREATAADHDGLMRVAALDSSPLPDGALLVGEAGGEIRAAVAVGSGRTIADPFHRTSELVALLHTRAGQIRSARKRRLRIVARSTNVPPASSGFALRGRPGQVAGRA